jgi:thiosulfate dehydrogenase [quinone] large subunit
MNTKYTKVFLRVALAVGFLSACADRFGMWSPEVSAWGNWNSFVEYTQLLNPLVPNQLISAVAAAATFFEILFGFALLLGFKTKLFAKLSGVLLLLFGLSMTFTTGIKGPLDYSVFVASAAAFALSTMDSKYLELESFLGK